MPPAERHDDNAATRDAFAKTAASGSKSWTLANVKVTYSPTKNQVPLSKRELACAVSGTLVVNGAYPQVEVSVPRLDCTGNAPSEVTKLFLLTSHLVYGARYAPALPDEPNQFRLDLDRASVDRFFLWEHVQSLNAGMRGHEVFFDLEGEERGRASFESSVHHYVEIAFPENGTKLRVTYDRDGGFSDNGAGAELELTADLEVN